MTQLNVYCRCPCGELIQPVTSWYLKRTWLICLACGLRYGRSVSSKERLACFVCGKLLKKTGHEYVCKRCNNKFKRVSGYLIRQVPVKQMGLPKVYNITAPEGRVLFEEHIKRLKNMINDIAKKKTRFVYGYYKTDFIRIKTKELTELAHMRQGYIDQGRHVWSVKPKELELVELWGRRFAKRHYKKLRRTLQLKYRGKIFERDGNKCRVCESTGKLELAHIIPVAVVIGCGLPMNAAFVGENLVTLCGNCHVSLHSPFKNLLNLVSKDPMRHREGVQASATARYIKTVQASAKKAIVRFAERKIGISPKALTFPDPLPWR